MNQTITTALMIFGLILMFPVDWYFNTHKETNTKTISLWGGSLILLGILLKSDANEFERLFWQNLGANVLLGLVAIWIMALDGLKIKISTSFLKAYRIVSVILALALFAVNWIKISCYGLPYMAAKYPGVYIAICICLIVYGFAGIVYNLLRLYMKDEFKFPRRYLFTAAHTAIAMIGIVLLIKRG
jgi:hypothetical protein